MDPDPSLSTSPTRDTGPARGLALAAAAGVAAAVGPALLGAPAWASVLGGLVGVGLVAVVAARHAAREGRARAEAERRQRDEAEAARRARAVGQRWRAVFDSVAAGVLLVRRPEADEAAAIRIIAGNAAMGALLGRDAGGLAGADLEEVFTDAMLADLVRRVGPDPEAEEQAVQVRVVGPERTVHLDVAARPGPIDADGATLVLTFTDSTEAAQAAQLKMDFAANAGHELRTPIAAIRLAAETMAGAAGNPTMTERLRRMIEDNVRRLEEMIEDLLDLSRLESPELSIRTRAVDVLELTERLDELLSPHARERSVEIRWQVDEAARVVLVDPLLLELVVRNLVDNAVKFARPGTPVVVEMMGERMLGAERADAVLRVIDQGVGIPLKDQQRIFERFFQVDASRDGHNRRRGTGLGLAIVKHALRRLGGTIRVDSVWQQGTTMTVRLPGCVGQMEELRAQTEAELGL